MSQTSRIYWRCVVTVVTRAVRSAYRHSFAC
jgi:hypothetical protein